MKHVCGPHFPLRSHTLGPPHSVLRDVPGNVMNNEVGRSGSLARWCCFENFASVCRMSDTENCRLELDAERNSGWCVVHKPTQGQVRLKRRGFAFCLDARLAGPAQVCVTPVFQEDAAMELVVEPADEANQNESP